MCYNLWWHVLHLFFYFFILFNCDLDGILCQLYMWHYKNARELSSPVFVLKTRRSLRAVHFHPHGAPYLLTAQVSELTWIN